MSAKVLLVSSMSSHREASLDASLERSLSTPPTMRDDLDLAKQQSHAALVLPFPLEVQ